MMTMTKQEQITAALDAISKDGAVEVNGHVIGADGPIIRVYNVLSKQLVAYSSMEADFELSLREFVGDYAV